jgi:hypothetical protein
MTESDDPEDGVQTFEFQSGLVVTLRRVNMTSVGKARTAARARFVRHWAEQHPDDREPQRPTYTVDVAGGETETYPHNEKTVQADQFKDDQELREAWDLFQEYQRGIRFAVHDASFQYHAVNGVVDDPPQEWLADRAYWGIEVPDDPRARKWDWLFDRSTGYDEIMELAAAIQRIPSPVEVAARAVAESFRAGVDGRAGQDADAGADRRETERAGAA